MESCYGFLMSLMAGDTDSAESAMRSSMSAAGQAVYSPDSLPSLPRVLEHATVKHWYRAGNEMAGYRKPPFLVTKEPGKEAVLALAAHVRQWGLELDQYDLRLASFEQMMTEKVDDIELAGAVVEEAGVGGGNVQVPGAMPVIVEEERIASQHLGPAMSTRSAARKRTSQKSAGAAGPDVEAEATAEGSAESKRQRHPASKVRGHVVPVMRGVPESGTAGKGMGRGRGHGQK
jgi:hypothetical protein